MSGGMTRKKSPAALLGILLATLPAPLAAQQGSAEPAMTYADLADLSDGAQLVLRANVRKQAALEPERATGVAPGHVRLYVEARTTALISGSVPVGEALRYLVDVPLDSRGKVPKLKNREVLLFAKPVAGRPGEIQLVATDAQLLWSESVETRVRDILRESVAPDAPPRLRGVRDVLSVAGTLTGESETQLFIDTAGQGPLSITVARRPGQPAVWGVSWSEIVDQAARPPERETLEWYRLACFLPAQLPSNASLSADPADRRRAEQDYRFVLEQLGPCPRNRS